jgi:hypothetical protein
LGIVFPGRVEYIVYGASTGTGYGRLVGRVGYRSVNARVCYAGSLRSDFISEFEHAVLVTAFNGFFDTAGRSSHGFHVRIRIFRFDSTGSGDTDFLQVVRS